MSHVQEIATTIRQQLFTQRTLVWCWGVPKNSWLAMPSNMEGDNNSLGALRFKFTNCRKVKTGLVYISLNGLDLYDITVTKPVRKRVPHMFIPDKFQYETTYETVKKVENAYAEDMHGIIDDIIGG